jgi:LmbE family N-acetylglucosaminyl deacetylase
MAVAFLLAHFDDEYCALPLILQARAAGEACWFLYVADYRDPRTAARRLAETRAFLASLGVEPGRTIHVGAGSGVLDGQVVKGLDIALARAREALSDLPPVVRFVAPAWEGGHPDHDCCAALAVRLAAERGGMPVQQFGLYNGRWPMKPLYRACAPIPENGPEVRLALSPRQWLAWIAAVRFFPSQTWNWLGLWPAMFLTFLVRGGFAAQSLSSERIRERPHAGRLHYEGMFRTPYETVRNAVDGMLTAPAPQRPGRARTRRKPTVISA